MYAAIHMSHWKDQINEIESPILLPAIIDNHLLKPISKSEPVCIQCLVCGLETSIQKSLGIQIVNTCDQSYSHMAICVHPKCGISAHSYLSYKIKWFVFNIREFCGLFCFEIAHHELSTRLFSSALNNSSIENFQTCSKKPRQQKSTKTSHVVFNMIQWMYADNEMKENEDSDSEEIDC